MSKIADYIEQQERARETQTVADFAMNLRRSPDAILRLLQKAGVQKNAPTDRISEADKKTLLHFLKSQYSNPNDTSREKIVIEKMSTPCESETDLLLKAVVEEKNGAEWGVLTHFAGLVIAENEIDPNLQAAVNLLVAQIVLCETLPLKKLGRPKSQEVEEVGLEIAQTYWDLRDQGESYSNAVSQLAGQFHKDERHIMRMVRAHKVRVGEDLQKREANRRSNEITRNLTMAIQSTEVIDDYLKSFYRSWPQFTFEEYIEFLDERLINTIRARRTTGIKNTLFIASD